MPANFMLPNVAILKWFDCMIDGLGGSFCEASGSQVNADCIFAGLGAEDILIYDTKVILFAAAGSLGSRLVSLMTPKRSFLHP